MSAHRPILLMTRPQPASDRFVASLNPDLVKKTHVVTAPLIRIEHISAAVDLAAVSGVIFTSANGVKALTAVTGDRNVPAFCVGPATTKAARDQGWTAHQCGQDAASLIASLLETKPAIPLLHVRGRFARGKVAETLTKQGLLCDELVLYDQVPQTLSEEATTALESDATVIAPVFSPRTAALLRHALPGRAIEFVALSPAVATELDGRAAQGIHVAATPNAEAMRVLVENLLQSAMPG